ncbi:MAG: helix-turn-helix transcriptional regulator [Flavobacteriales bacterium]
MKEKSKLRPEPKLNLSKSAMRRYMVIDTLLRNPLRRFPTMEEIIEACLSKLDYAPSIETIQKDIKNMKMEYPNGFGAPIRFCRLNKGYEYTDPNYTLTTLSLQEHEITTIENAIELINAIGGSRIGTKFNHAMQKVLSATLEKRDTADRLPILQTMNLPESKGLEHFDLFYSACKESVPLSFIHFSYQKRVFKHICLHPFLIKEFENRWYIIGYSETHGGIRTFGMDRIAEPEMIKKEFIPSDTQTVLDYLHDIYGVYPIPTQTKSTVVIHASELATHYLKAYPLHHSQKLTKCNNGDSVITFELIPSIELAQYILSQGKHLSILSPEWFVHFTQKMKS